MQTEGEVERYEWDDAKAAANEERHNVPFQLAVMFRWSTALDTADTRRNYGEERRIALGRIGDRLHVMVYTKRGETIRVISLRKANAREEMRYEGGVLR